jgi:hypothetical protein
MPVSTSGTVTAQLALSFVFTVTAAGQVNVGTLLSFTVTCTLQVVVFAGVDPSVAVTTIVNVPLSDTPVCAEAADGDCVIVAVPQLSDSSVMPVSTSGTVTAQLALSLVFTVTADGQVNVGTLLSFTVTCTLQVVVFAGVAPSVAVTTMVNVPLSDTPVCSEAAVGVCVIVAVPQLSDSSVMPVITSGTVTAQLALLLVFTVMAAGQVNVGTLLSFTVTCTLQVVVFAGVDPSVAVTTIVNVPLSDTPVCSEAAVGDCVIVAVPQLSDAFVMPVRTSGTVTAQPIFPFVFTVTAAGQVNVGASLSFTVMVVLLTAEQPSELETVTV